MVTPDEFRRLSRRLEDHHALFYMMWQLGRPVMDESIATACVRFGKSGELLEFAFNPDFWDSCNDDDRLFTIAHECLHVTLRHGIRTMDTKEPDRCNVALDLVVNHTLVNTFGFERESLTHGENFCWVDTVFPGRKDVDTNLSFEEYFSMVSPEDAAKFGMVDDHASWEGDSKDIVKELADRLGDDARESVKEMVESHSAGKSPGGYWRFVGSSPKPKRKWETVIKQWAKKYVRSNFHEVEQWARLHRRYTFLGGDLILPSDMEVEDEAVEGKIEVWFFQDTSGSCSTFAKRFFDAANSLPPDRFDVKMHCFDADVYETTLASGKIFGFGGTSFQAIEQYIQKHMAENRSKYPQAVFVITDGWGDHIQPEIPDRWYWFLSQNYRLYIPPQSKCFDLREFE